jgi:hypothetical protein
MRRSALRPGMGRGSGIPRVIPRLEVALNSMGRHEHECLVAYSKLRGALKPAVEDSDFCAGDYVNEFLGIKVKRERGDDASTALEGPIELPGRTKGFTATINPRK